MCITDYEDNRPIWAGATIFFYMFYISLMLSTPILFIRSAIRYEDTIELVFCIVWFVAGIIGFFVSIVFVVWVFKKKSNNLPYTNL